MQSWRRIWYHLEQLEIRKLIHTKLSNKNPTMPLKINIYMMWMCGSESLCHWKKTPTYNLLTSILWRTIASCSIRASPELSVVCVQIPCSLRLWNNIPTIPCSRRPRNIQRYKLRTATPRATRWCICNSTLFSILNDKIFSATNSIFPRALWPGG